MSRWLVIDESTLLSVRWDIRAAGVGATWRRLYGTGIIQTPSR
jgi:hypothetical protein